MLNFIAKVTLMSLVFSFAFSVSPVFAEQGTGEQVQANHDLFILFLGGESEVGQLGTLGDAIAGGWMGNITNDDPNSNGVLPSLAPGIWICTYGGTYDSGSGNSCEPVELGNPFGAFVSQGSQGQGQPS